jgi:Family of unknown function (DUF6356)
MSIWRRLFTDHPASVNESYLQHMTSASAFGVRMVWGGLVCFVHAIIPAIGSTTASDMICKLHDRMVTNRRRLSPGERAFETRRAA